MAARRRYTVFVLSTYCVCFHEYPNRKCRSAMPAKSLTPVTPRFTRVTRHDLPPTSHDRPPDTSGQTTVKQTQKRTNLEQTVATGLPFWRPRYQVSSGSLRIKRRAISIVTWFLGILQ